MLIGFLRIKLIQDILQQPLAIRLWIFFMIATNLCSLFFLQHGVAKWVVALNFCNLILMSYLYRHFAYSPILGLSHVVCWTPIVVIVWSEIKFNSYDSMYGVWLRVLIVTNSLSLMVDYFDVFRFFLKRTKH